MSKPRPHPLTAFRLKHEPPLNQDDLAKKLKVSASTLSRWEAGDRFPERRWWPRLREVTGLGPEDFASAIK